ncbi:rhodanese-like domain-containing protein [Butyrivibrio sp. MC2021]|uniref:rhodanese-like domain-containing protein n=1 Tax=Butyrivibrio sp. MC2021 TaxID=1408306 RepID=UPI00047AC7AE|nr:rhodanese-like domain-containing protein [Butyrivibrio sp. MC2021]
MTFLNIFKSTNINDELVKYRSLPDAILLDVRTKEEYAEGYIPGSINIPLDDILEVENIVPDHDKQIFVYCLRGTRSKKAVSKMKMLGYKNAVSIGGIASYKGPLGKK